MRARPRATGRGVTWFVALAMLIGLAGCAPDDTTSALHVAEISGNVNNVMDRYVDRAVTHAEDSQAVGIVFIVDTPGGEISAMKSIAGRMERAEVPVITWVGPPGAQAASAGTFITMAGHIAAMAPNTTIGAATPVTITGDEVPSAMERKVTEDTVAFARGLADHHDRNADWAERAVRDAASAPPSEAVEINVVDLVASSLPALLEEIEGRSVTLLDGRSVDLAVQDAPQVENSPNSYERALGLISDPLIVSMLLLLGMAGIVIELFAPGLFLPGAAGLISILLAFLGLGTLLPGEAALALLVLGIVLIGAEFFVPGGILAFIGSAALLLALAIWAGQLSTTMSLGRGVLAVTLVLIVVLVPIGVWLLRYLGGNEETGTRAT